MSQKWHPIWIQFHWNETRENINHERKKWSPIMSSAKLSRAVKLRVKGIKIVHQEAILLSNYLSIFHIYLHSFSTHLHSATAMVLVAGENMIRREMQADRRNYIRHLTATPQKCSRWRMANVIFHFSSIIRIQYSPASDAWASDKHAAPIVNRCG